MAIQKVKKRLNEIVDEAQTRLDLETAQNPELRRAITIVEAFLKKTGRVCYGGQAINAQLPVKDQFYDPEKSLPDYDFFSPNAKSDVDNLIKDFKDAGYTEISKKVGIHDGTIKVYVNYAAVADISQLIPDFYDIIYKKSVTVQGIRYTDPIFLRMLMYLEISRPRGQVERWQKVYERLNLLDAAHPLKSCNSESMHLVESRAAEKARPILVRYMIANRRVFMGADIHKVYKSTVSVSDRSKFLLNGSAPIVFFSPNADLDGDVLAKSTLARKESILGYQNMIPAMIALYHDKNLICLIVQEEACHSIVTLPLTKQRYLRLASPDTLLTFLISLYYRPQPLLTAQDSILCWIRQYIDISNRYKNKPTKLIPAFSIECSGYQTTFASLLREKAARIEAARQEVGSGKRSSMTRNSMTRNSMPRGSMPRNSMPRGSMPRGSMPRASMTRKSLKVAERMTRKRNSYPEP